MNADVTVSFADIDEKLLDGLLLTDLIDLDELQTLQDAFARANKIAATIVNVYGEPITRPSNHSPVCTLIRQTSVGFANCVRSGKILGLKSLERKEPHSIKCHSVGFMDACAPIVIQGVHVANWLIGQNCVGDVDEARIAAYAEEIEADREEMLIAFRKMDKISEADFREKLSFLWIMGSQLSDLAYRNLRHHQMLASLQEMTERLEKYKKNLEQLVDERTAQVETLSGLVPICMHCKKIRDDQGYWNQLEAYIEQRSKAEFSHSICQKCMEQYYPDLNDEL
jgi:ligand-binding sensor protein